MRISGPYRDRKAAEGAKAWYLDFYVPRMNPDGTAVLKDGRRVLRRLRPRHKTRDLAIADLHNIKSQLESAGVGHAGILTRTQATEYEQAKVIAPEANVAELAQFWRRYHPVQKTLKIGELVPIFLAANEARVGVTRHGADLKSRLGMFGTQFGNRLPITIEREEIMTYLLSLGKSGRRFRVRKPCSSMQFNRKMILARKTPGSSTPC